MKILYMQNYDFPTTLNIQIELYNLQFLGFAVTALKTNLDSNIISNVSQSGFNLINFHSDKIEINFNQVPLVN